MKTASIIDKRRERDRKYFLNHALRYWQARIKDAQIIVDDLEWDGASTSKLGSAKEELASFKTKLRCVMEEINGRSN